MFAKRLQPIFELATNISSILFAFLFTGSFLELTDSLLHDEAPLDAAVILDPF